MSLSLIALPGAEACAERLAHKLDASLCRLEHRRFADGEQYLRVADEVSGRDVAVVAQLRDPDPQLPGLLFLADALRELGATDVGLIAPYLPYMRQDARFRPGEAVTSLSVGKWISGAFDWLATVDPHLHRHPTLDAVFKLPNAAVPSAPAIALWVHGHVTHPYIVGPDEESEQWAAQVASLANCPYTVLHKRRLSDRQVDLRLPDLEPLRGRTPVLVDDIIASAHTMAEAVRKLRTAGLPGAVCVGVHPVFAGDAARVLQQAGASRVVSCNTLPHPSNAIDISEALAEAVRMLRFEHPSQASPVAA
jgi:ribose-phosphate pyrophosphokinase